MKTHPDLYEESIELEDLVKEYTSSKKYKELEKCLIRLVDVYNSLNYCEEDEYIEELIEAHLKLINIYLIDDNKKKIIKHYYSILECYDILIQNDRNEEDLIKKYIEKVREINIELIKFNNSFDIRKEFPRLKQYI